MSNPNLTRIQSVFVECVKLSLDGRTLEQSSLEPSLSAEDYAELFRLSEEHSVLPMVYETIYGREDFKALPLEMQGTVRQRVMQSVMRQVQQTSEFLRVYQMMDAEGAAPLVVKGIICRALYPNPDDRISGDEDLYIDKECFVKAAEVLQKAGLVPVLDFLSEDEQKSLRAEQKNKSNEPMGSKNCPANEINEIPFRKISPERLPYEITFYNPRGALTIELHRSLFPENDAAYRDMNECFNDAFEQSVTETIDGVGIRTLPYEEHLLFLILHAYKHFLTGGFGIRQVCDMAMFANRYGKEIDWLHLLKTCERLHVGTFAASLMALGQKYLNFDPQKAGCPDIWADEAKNPDDLLADILKAGSFGFSDMNRKHSSNITLNTVEAERKAESDNEETVKNASLPKSQIGSKIKTVFPDRKVLAGRYPYLRKYPFLLPVAWTDRIAHYVKNEGGGHTSKDAIQTLKIGDERVALLKEYGILKSGEKMDSTDSGTFFRENDSDIHEVNTNEYVSMLRELVDEGKTVSLLISGSSMSPFLIHHRDTIYFRKPDRPLKRGDMVFYQRRNGQYVMHRIQKVVHHPDGRVAYRILGDNQSEIEHGVRPDQIFAIVVAVRRKGQMIRPGDFWWEFFAHTWLDIIPLRRGISIAYHEGQILKQKLSKKA